MNKIRGYGIIVGNCPTGALNKITDVLGVTVGHYTIKNKNINTGITAIIPCKDDIYKNKMVAACHIINGYGKSVGLTQIEELGCIETPILLTNTLSVGSVSNGLIDYMLENDNITSLNPVVGECNDYPLNDIRKQVFGKEEVKKAIKNAKTDFEEGSVGAGTGTSCLGLKGGIGSSSRVMYIDDRCYTIGVLVQSNFGSARDLTIDGKKLGNIVEKISDNKTSKGSIMIIVATDLPVDSRQLKRILKKSEIGIVKTGSYISHYSGDIVIGFTTANRINSEEKIHDTKILREDILNRAFKMVAEATEEAILNSLAMAQTLIGYKTTKYSLYDFYLKKLNKNYISYINNFPVVNQFPNYPTGCESVALYTLLRYYNVDVSIEDIIDNLEKEKPPYVKSGIKYGPNPEEVFVGDPTSINGYGVYDKPIEKVANIFKKGIKNITGSPLKKVLNLVKKGNPVQVWISIKMLPSKISNIWIDDKTGEVIKWKSQLHSVVIVGYSNDKIIVSDPDAGAIRSFDLKEFEKSYNYFGSRALYYKNK